MRSVTPPLISGQRRAADADQAAGLPALRDDHPPTGCVFFRRSSVAAARAALGAIRRRSKASPRFSPPARLSRPPLRSLGAVRATPAAHPTGTGQNRRREGSLRREQGRRRQCQPPMSTAAFGVDELALERAVFAVTGASSRAGPTLRSEVSGRPLKAADGSDQFRSAWAPSCRSPGTAPPSSAWLSMTAS
jgi:hypothetical protein